MDWGSDCKRGSRLIGPASRFPWHLLIKRGLIRHLPQHGVCGVELNTRGRYAVMAMADLAKASQDQPSVPLSAIADRQQISLAYLEQLFVKLRRAGLIESERGRSGGYRLARPAGEISVADVLNAVEEKTEMTRCGQDAAEPCVAGQRCLTHGLWDALGTHIDQFLKDVTLKQVIDGTLKTPKARAQVPLRAPEHFIGGIWPR